MSESNTQNHHVPLRMSYNDSSSDSEMLILSNTLVHKVSAAYYDGEHGEHYLSEKSTSKSIFQII